AVLDFDCISKYKLFCQLFSHLTNTYTVKTPNGWHLYFHIPKTCTTRTLQKDGIDWQWEGRYVVAPPTEGYTLEQSQAPKTLSATDISQIEAFVNGNPLSLPSVDSDDQAITSVQDLIGYYNKHAYAGNRNTALFKAALMARDYSFSIHATIQALSRLHAYNAHAHESYTQREREALATIRSAFSRPPRAVRESVHLPNLIKEALMEQGLTSVVRVLEGLRLSGYETGQGICRKEAIQVLDGVIGRHSIRKAFASGLLECIVDSENPYPKAQTSVAGESPIGTISKCKEISVSKPTQTFLGGRPSHWYRLPSHAQLAAALGVKHSRIADALSLDDLSSATTTRKAFYRAYLERRPGQYHTTWLAKRIGVSRVTKNRYDRAIPDLNKRAEYSAKRLYWGNLNTIPDIAVPGMFLEDEQGKRYPAKRALAGKLIKQGKQIKLCKQLANTYWIGSKFDTPYAPRRAQALEPQASQPTTVIATPEPWRKSAAVYWASIDTPSAPQIVPQRSNSSNIRIIKPISITTLDHSIQALKATVSTHEHDPQAADVDAAAQTFKEALNGISGAGHTISLESMHRLIARYGLAQVGRAINTVLKRDQVENPPGLLTVILRSETRVAELKSG
ncbi:MAG: bifunctional DNA primase/polymerase, partial [Phototrophicaceae bacterium]